MPIASRIPSNNDPDDMTHARCFCDRAYLSETQLSNGRGDVICSLLHDPWASR
jgi:hypothetical protein